jgi:hypothetical protein
MCGVTSPLVASSASVSLAAGKGRTRSRGTRATLSITIDGVERKWDDDESAYRDAMQVRRGRGSARTRAEGEARTHTYAPRPLHRASPLRPPSFSRPHLERVSHRPPTASIGSSAHRRAPPLSVAHRQRTRASHAQREGVNVRHTHCGRISRLQLIHAQVCMSLNDRAPVCALVDRCALNPSV